MDRWNSGAALNPDSPVVAAWMGEIAKRARHDATAQRSSVRSQFKCVSPLKIQLKRDTSPQAQTSEDAAASLASAASLALCVK